MQPLDAPVRETPIGKAPIVPDEDDAVQNLIDGVWERYGGYSAGKLSDMTHAKGTPWQEEAAARNYKVPRHLQIGVDRIRTYFRNPLNHMDATAL